MVRLKTERPSFVVTKTAMPKHSGFVLDIYVNVYRFKLRFACQQIVNLPAKLLGFFNATKNR